MTGYEWYQANYPRIVEALANAHSLRDDRYLLTGTTPEVPDDGDVIPDAPNDPVPNPDTEPEDAE